MSQLSQPSQRTLEDSIGRAVKFLSAVGTNSTILALLRERGFQPADQEEGWTLVHTAAGYVKKSDAPAESEQARATADAIAQLDNWDEPNFRVIDSALSRKFASTRDYLFRGGLSPKQGAEAVLSVKTLLDRMDEIAANADPERSKEEHQQDLDALRLLEARGYHSEEKTRLRKLIQTATTAATDVELPKPISEEDRHQALLELYRWYKDWSSTAHAFIKRRDYLILLGLAERKKNKKTEE